MSVKIRLSVIGKRNARQFRIVVVDESEKRNGKVIETIGLMNPLKKPARIDLKKDRVDYWISKGAQLTNAVKKLFV